MRPDTRELCIIHANCQGEPLTRLLEFSPEFSARWRVRHYTNYTREAIPAEALGSATLFLHQHLGREWGAFASERLCAALRSGARSLCVPNMFFKGYWPFWTHAGPMDFADSLLDKLCASGAGKPEILAVYLGRAPGMADAEAVAGESLRIEREKEMRCDVATAHFVAENWRKRRLFQTVNHPGEELLILTAQGILSHLGLPPLSEDVCASFSYDYEGFHLPIHPGISARLGLAFAGEGTLYPVFGREMSFSQYVSRYVDCRLNGFEDSFLGYLQLV